MESNPGVDGKSVPVYDWSEKGPYWLHPPPDISNSDDGAAGSHIDENRNDGDKEESGSTPFHSGTELGKSGKYVIPPKSSYIFTKTHCGSRCAFCPPKKYLETWRSFLKMCLTGSRSVPYASDSANEQKINPKLIHGKNLKLPTIYHPSIVKKAVHLIRNPFDNLVSRFHHELKEHAKKKDARWMSRYENSISGFRTWCADQDATFYKDEHKEDWEEWGYDDDIMRYFEGVPCHADFFRYAQWHSLANRVVQKMDIPVLYIYYDEYLTDLEGSTKDILEFLNLPHIGDLPTFDSNKDYSGYFTQEERAVASELMRRVANEDGRRLLERYWVSLDFEKLRKETKELN